MDKDIEVEMGMVMRIEQAMGMESGTGIEMGMKRYCRMSVGIEMGVESGICWYHLH